MRAYIDTNMLLVLASGTRVLDLLAEEYPEYEVCVAQGVIKELEHLEKTLRGVNKRAAKLALDVAAQQHLKVVSHSDSHVDDALLALATSKDVLVTLDKELIKRARKQGLRVLTFANKRLRFVA